MKYLIPQGRLWPNTPSGAPLSIEVFGATGAYKSGKTLLGLSIAPGVHPGGHPFEGKARTLYLDFEKSGGTYGGTGCCRIDVPAKMLELTKGHYRPLDVFLWFLDLVENKIQPKQFDVIVCDPITDIESGQVDWVKANSKLFGLTEGQINKGGGLLWGAVKDSWKQILLKLATKCQCFYFTAHLRQVWEGNTPVAGKKEPKGKDTLMELSSLYLWLEREPDKKGIVSPVPAAVVLKERLADTCMAADGQLSIVQLLPPRLPVATVDAIRTYIANPPDYASLAPAERVVEKELTEQEKLQLQLQISENQKETEQNRVALLARQEELKRLSLQQTLQKPQEPDQTAAMQMAKRAAEQAAAAKEKEAAEIARLTAEAEAAMAKSKAQEAKLLAETPAETVSGPQISRAREIFGAIGKPAAAFKNRCGGLSFARLTPSAAAGVLVWLEKVAEALELGDKIRTGKSLSVEAWDRVVAEKILLPVKAKTIADLEDQNLDGLLKLFKAEVEKLQKN